MYCIVHNIVTPFKSFGRFSCQPIFSNHFFVQKPSKFIFLFRLFNGEANPNPNPSNSYSTTFTSQNQKEEEGVYDQTVPPLFTSQDQNMASILSHLVSTKQGWVRSEISWVESGQFFPFRAHSSEIRGLRSTKCSSKTLQNLLYFMCQKTHVVFFVFHFVQLYIFTL